MKRKVWELTVLDNPNRAVGGESDIFYTTDTEAFLIFRLTDEDFNPATATLTLVNTSDKSVISETVPVVDKEIEWEMTEEAIVHSGNWQAQLVYTQEKAGKPERYTAPIIQFDIQNHLLTGRQPSLVAIEDWNTFMADAQELIETWEDLEALREENERQRQANEQVRVSAESVRVANEAERIVNEQTRELAESNRATMYSEVTAGRTSTVTGDSYATVGDRLDEIEKMTVIGNHKAYFEIKDGRPRLRLEEI